MMDDSKKVPHLPAIMDRNKETQKSNEIKAITYYTMDRIRHKLPHPQSLKPHIEMKTANIDLWPSHASSQNSGNIVTKLTKNKSLEFINAERLGKPNFIPKPKTLDEIKGYLNKELGFIETDDEDDNSKSLEVYRKSFSYLINKLKSYKNLLSRIKIQYEMVLDHLENEISNLKPVKDKFYETAEECEKKLLDYAEQVKPEIVDMKEQNIELERQIKLIEEKIFFLEIERGTMEEKLKKNYELFRNEHDAKNLLILELEELKILYSKTQFQNDSSSQEPVGEDLTTLKITLKQSIKDADAIQEKLDQMLSEYKDVVPRRHFENLEKKFAELKENNDQLINDLNTLNAEHNALSDVNQKLDDEVQSYKNECTKKKKMLPRPPWVKSCQFINAASDFLKCLSSKNICESLLNILHEMDKNGAKILKRERLYFEGKGLDESIPSYLRCKEKVFNRQFSKQETIMLIKDIWKKRLQHYKKGVNFTTFMNSYLNKHFPIPLMKTEWAYNLEDACRKFSSANKSFELFLEILNGVVDENVYHTQQTIITDLMSSLNEAAGPNSVIKVGQFEKTLKKFLNPNDPKIITSLVNTALGEMESSDEIKIDQLFLEDDVGETTKFLNELKEYLQSVRFEFCDMVSKELEENSPVSIQSLDLAIRQTDPTLKTNSVKDLLCWCFKTTPDAILKAKPAPFDEIISRLRNGNIKYSQMNL